MTAEKLVSPRKIAVLHDKALGDFIMTLPALTAIKKTYPEAELTLLAGSWVKEFVSGRVPAIDRVITIPNSIGELDTAKNKGQALKNENTRPASPEFERFVKTLRTEAFDIVMHMHDDGRAGNQFINRLGAILTVGPEISEAEPLDRSIPYSRYQNEILRNLEVADLIGARTDDFSPRIVTTDQDHREIADIIESLGKNPLIVLHPGSGDVRRRWPPVKFAAVADTFTERGYGVILTGTPKEKPIITEIIQYIQRTALAQTSLSLGALAALLKNASLVISNDTGPLHLARAVGTRTVGIVSLADIPARGPLYGKDHRLAVSTQLECPHCKTKLTKVEAVIFTTAQCGHQFSFVETVPISEVISLASELLNSAAFDTDLQDISNKVS